MPFRLASPARALFACAALAPLSFGLHAQTASDEFPPAEDEPLMLDPVVVEGDDASGDLYDPTGLDGREAERSEPPFANELLTDPAFDELPLGELDSELDALAAARVNAAEVAAGSETVDLRGFPTPFRRNGFTQSGIPEVLNPGRSELVIGSLVAVVGRAAPGGIRNIETERPRGRVQRQLATSIGTNGAWRAQASASGVVVPKKSWYLASLTRSGRDGPQRYSETAQTNAGASLAIRHSRATSTLWSVDVLDLEGNPAPGLPEYRRTSGGPIVGPYRPLAEFHSYGPNASVHRQAGSFSFQLESQIGPELSLSSATQVYGRRAKQDRFTTGQYVEDTGKFSGLREPTHREESHRGIAHQTDLTRRFHVFGADHKLLGGVEWSASSASDENRGLRTADRNTLLPESVRVFDPYDPNYYRPDYSPSVYRRVLADRETRLGSAAGVLTLRSAFNRGRTVFTAGLRRELMRVEVNDRRVAPDAPTSNFVPRAEKRLANTSLHAGVNQRVGRRVLVFATTSSAVQPSTRVDARTGAIQDNASTAGIDCGFRAQFLERRLTVGAMAYAYTNADIVRRNPLYQDPVADADHTQPQLVTSGEEEFRGVTTQLGWKPDKHWTFTTRLAWIDAYTVSSPDLPEEEGRPLTRLPRFSAAGGLRRSFSAGTLRGLSVGGTVTHVGAVTQSYERPGRERLDYPAYTLAGLDSSYTWKAGRVTHTVTAAVGNVFDTDLLAKIARVGAERSLTVGWRVAF